MDNAAVLTAASEVEMYLRRYTAFHAGSKVEPVLSFLRTSTALEVLRADQVQQVLDGLRDALAAQNNVYRERARLVSFLTTLFPTVWSKDADDPDWTIVYLTTPAGQLSWHISPQDWDLFAHVPHNPDIEWDGHDFWEKYERLRILTERTL